MSKILHLNRRTLCQLGLIAVGVSVILGMAAEFYGKLNQIGDVKTNGSEAAVWIFPDSIGGRVNFSADNGYALSIKSANSLITTRFTKSQAIGYGSEIWIPRKGWKIDMGVNSEGKAVFDIKKGDWPIGAGGWSINP